MIFILFFCSQVLLKERREMGGEEEVVSVELPAPSSWKKLVCFLCFLCSF